MPYPTSKTAFETYRAGQTTLEISTLVTMVLVVRSFRSRLDEQLRKINQSTARMETLAAILNMPGDKSQSDVAKRLRVEGATVTRMIDQLGKEGLVERIPHPNDRRINLLSLTPAGEEAVEAIFQTYDRMRGHLLAEFSAQEIEQLHKLVAKMLRQLDEPPETALKIEDMPALDRPRDRLKDDGD